PRRNRQEHRSDQRQNPTRRANENPHHARDRQTRHGSRRGQRSHSLQRKSRRQAARRRHRRNFVVDQRTARVVISATMLLPRRSRSFWVVVSLITGSLVVFAQNDPQVAIAKKQAELGRQKIALEKKRLELE